VSARNRFLSGCPGSLMESYVRCGGAINERECGRLGSPCVWYDELSTSAKAGAPAPSRGFPTRRRSLAQAGGMGGGAAAGQGGAARLRACMPKQLFLLERQRDAEGLRRALRGVETRDPAGERGAGGQGLARSGSQSS
jgi:hypothetical protein